MRRARIFLPPGTYTGVDIAGGTVPALTAGTIAQATPTVGMLLTVTGSNAIDGATFQWRRNGTAIAGATSASYLTVSADAGQVITRTVSLGDKQAPATTPGVTVGGVLVNPTITAATFTAGTPATLAISVSYAGADALQVILAMRAGGTALTAAQMQAGTGAFLERHVITPFVSATVNLDSAFTSASNAATAVDILAREINNGNVSSVVSVAVSGLNFGTGWSISASSILSSPTVAPPTVSGSSITG